MVALRLAAALASNWKISQSLLAAGAETGSFVQVRPSR